MASITVKNIPERLYEQLKLMAKIRHRSVNKEIISCLEASLSDNTMHPEEIRTRAKMFRDTIHCAVEPEEIERSLKERGQ